MADEQRPAHGSALGHSIGIGGNGLLWALGTYGWGVAAAIGGLFGIFAISSLRRRRRSNKRGSGLGGRTAGSKGIGGGLRRLLGGKRSGGRSGSSGRGSSRSGLLGGKGSKSGKGGFLRRMAERRSTSPGRRGGLPGRGGDKTGRMSRLLGRSGGKRTPGGKASSATGGGSKGSKAGSRQQSGNATPRGGRLRNLFGRGGKGSGGKPPKGPKGSKGGKDGGKKGKNGGFTCILPSRDKGGKKKKRNPLSGWEEAPTKPKGLTLMPDTTTPPAPRRSTTRKPASPRAASTPAGAAGRGFFASAAEQLRAALIKPAKPVVTVKALDHSLEDLHGAMAILAQGLTGFQRHVEDGMPDEGAVHEQLGQYAAQIAQMAEWARLMQTDQFRRNAADHERIDNHRRNEQGYDFKTNTE